MPAQRSSSLHPRVADALTAVDARALVQLVHAALRRLEAVRNHDASPLMARYDITRSAPDRDERVEPHG